MLLQEKLKNKRIILASQSPRRHELLKGLNINFEVVDLEIDEVYPEDLKAEKITEFLSKKKAESYLDLKENEIIIAADTIVWANDSALGKPKNKTEACNMLKELSGKIHSVFTSVTLKSTEKSITFSEETKVFFSDLNKEEIEYYVDNYKPFDKAGAYGIQEWIGFALIKKIEGSYFNVMGLPVHKLYAELKKI